MSTEYTPPAPMQTRRDASGGVPLTTPFDQTRGMIYPSMYTMPGPPPPPPPTPRNATPSAHLPFVPGPYDTGYVNHFPNHQDYGTVYPPTDFVPPMRNPAPLVCPPNFQTPDYTSCNMHVGVAAAANALGKSDYARKQEQVPEFTFQQEYLLQPQEVLSQQQQFQYEAQCLPESLAMVVPEQAPGGVQGEGCQTQESCHAAPIEPEYATVHECFNNSQTMCSGQGLVCIDTLCELVAKYPDVLSPAQAIEFMGEAAERLSNLKQSAPASFAQVNTGDSDLLPSQQDLANWKMLPSGLGAVVSTSSAEAPSSGTSVSPPSYFMTTFSSVDDVGSSTGKRRHCGGCLVDRPRKRRGQCTQALDAPSNAVERRRNRAIKDNDKAKKKKNIDGELICLICWILKKPCDPFSRKDSLKRHIKTWHQMFAMLVDSEDHWHFRMLKPRHVDQLEDLRPLIAFCINAQNAVARTHGVQIDKKEDLSKLHPDVDEWMRQS